MSNLVKLQEEAADLLYMLNNKHIEVRLRAPDAYNSTEGQFKATLKRIISLCEAVKEGQLNGKP